MATNRRFVWQPWLYTLSVTVLGMTGSTAAEAQSGSPSVNVLTHHNDNGRTGANLNEAILKTSNVTPQSFGKLFALPVDGQVYAQPLYVSGVVIGTATHNVVYVATEHNSVFAFDADVPGAPLWKVNFGVPWNCGCTKNNLYPEEGITATPVIDPVSNTIYVVDRLVTGGVLRHYLHALDITSGAEKFSGPVRIQATVPGTGEGGSSLTYSEMHERLRPALSLVNGNVIFGTGSYGDWSPFHGWIFAYNAKTLAQTAVWNSTPNGDGASFWQSGAGFVADASGNIYAMSANGDFDGIANFGTSFLKLSTVGGLSLLDYFTPNNQSFLSSQDDDLGSSGPMQIPGTNLLVGAGKAGELYVLSEAAMGGYSASGPDQVVQEFQVTPGLDQADGHEMHGVPTFWAGANGHYLYTWGANDVLKAWSFNGTLFDTTPASVGSAMAPATNGPGNPGGILSLSANGSTAGTGIVWANTPYSGDPEYYTSPGILRAYDASNVATELWNSRMNFARDDLGNFAKFVPPTIANGKVYAATFSNQVVVYGLLATGFSLTASSNATSVMQGGSASVSVTVNPNSGFTGSVTMSASGLPAGLSATFGSTTVVAGGSTNITFKAGASAQLGSYPIVIAAANAGKIQTTTIHITITAFQLSATPSQVITPGNPSSWVITINQANAAAVTNLHASGLPSGSIATFSPASLTGSGTSILTVSSSSSLTWGNYPLTITATAGSAQQTLTVTLVVADFSISATPSLLTIPAGSSGAFTVQVTPLNGFTGTVNLSMPAGTSGALSAPSIPGKGTATLTIAVPKAVPPGSYPIYVTGTSGRLSHQAAVWTVVPGLSFTPIRIKSGGASAFTDNEGNVWSADTFFGLGGTYTLTIPVTGTSDPGVYSTLRYGTFLYSIPVPDGSYTITLKFAEPTMQAAGKRVFNVTVNGTAALTNFDIFAHSNGEGVALDEAIPVSVHSSPITIQFSPVVNAPIVNAIMIAAQTAGQTATK